MLGLGLQLALRPKSGTTAGPAEFFILAENGDFAVTEPLSENIIQE